MIIERLFIAPAPDAAQVDCPTIAVVAGLGIRGDHNFGRNDYPGQNLTLVEAEEIERFCAELGRPVDLSLTRRNLVTRGLRLNDLVHREFRIGDVLVRGVELCEPCSRLGRALSGDGLSAAAVVALWTGHGGLRVDVLSDGEIGRGARLSIAG